MKEWVSLKSLLVNIPKPLFNESEESDFLFWFREALRLLPNTTATESKIEIFEVVNNRIQLPKYVKTINQVMYMYKDPSPDCIKSYEDCIIPVETQDILPQLCKPEIYYKMFLDSPYYRNNYRLLRYVGSDKSILCNNCPNFNCDSESTFTLSRDRILNTSFDCGFICINYDTEVCDELGNLLIPDIQEVHNFLQSYAIKRHLEERMFSKEEAISQMYQMYSQKSDIEYKKARGIIMLRQINPDVVRSLQGSWFRRAIKLPSIYIYERQDY